MSEDSTILFSKYELSAVIEAQERRVLEAIANVDGNRLLNASIDDLCDHFEREFRIEVPVIKDTEITVQQEEAAVDVRGYPNRIVLDMSQPLYVRGTAVTFFVPFDGDAALFACRPSHFTFNPPRGQVEERELIMIYKVLDHRPDAIKTDFERNLAAIRTWLGRIGEAVAPFNASLRQKLRGQIDARRDKLLKDQGLVASLGYPLRQRPDAPRTYTAPEVRHKAVPPTPKASAAPFVPEPALDMKEYERILSVVSNMVAVMERSPHAFKEMKEEDLRQHFLVQLHGQYEG